MSHGGNLVLKVAAAAGTVFRSTVAAAHVIVSRAFGGVQVSSTTWQLALVGGVVASVHIPMLDCSQASSEHAEPCEPKQSIKAALAVQIRQACDVLELFGSDSEPLVAALLATIGMPQAGNIVFGTVASYRVMSHFDL